MLLYLTCHPFVLQVSSLIDYDPREDQVVGPHNYLQQVMLRSLVDS